MAGRLTLSWLNKDQALMPDGAGGYEWVERDDPRVTEVRLLHPAGQVGEVTNAPTDNLLIEGDSYDALHALSRTPKYAQHYRGNVKLAYLDPPFNTGQAFEHYNDALEHSIWLGMMRERLLLIRELLAPNGSVWVHLDDAEMAYCRVLMDEIFGRSSFVASVVWQKKYSRDNRPAIGDVHDYLIVYSPLGQAWKHVRNRIPRTAAKEYRNPNGDPRGPWRPIPLDVQAGHATAGQFYDVVTPAGRVRRPASGRAWSVTEARMDELRTQEKVYFGRDGDGMPNLVRYLDEDEGLVPWSWWPQEEVGHNDESKKEIYCLFPSLTPFATPKPERLLQRIIQISSNPDDIVLDCFVGSGTTAAVAHKMGRRWLVAEISPETIDQFARPRLTKVVGGEDAGGITADVGWAGGGGFRELTVGPSMYERAGERVVLADWAKGQEFVQAVAAQLGFSYGPTGPFAGAKGRTRLAVVDGVADDVVIKSVVSYLDEGERVTIVAKGSAPGADQALRELSSGSRVLKAPRDLLRRGRVLR
jgi:adenine-specific DNA-methyltransferase